MKISLNFSLAALFYLLVCIPMNTAYPSLNILLRYCQLVGFVWSCFVFISKKQWKIKWYYPLWILAGLMLVSTAYNDLGALYNCALWLMRMFIVVILLEDMMQRNIRRTISWIALIWSIFFFIEVFSLVTGCFGFTHTNNTQGLPNYFFGIRNEVNQYIIYAVLFCFLAMYLKDFLGTAELLLTSSCGIFFVLSQSVSVSIVGIAAFVGVYVISKIIKRRKSWKYIIALIAIAIFSFIVFQNTVMFQTILVDWLNEDMTLNGRLLLWKQAIQQSTGIHALLGYGYSPDYTLCIGTYAVNHPHNQYIQFIFNYGYPGLILYLYMLYISCRKILNVQNTKIRMVFIATLIANAIMSISSRNYFYLTAQMFYVLVLHADEIGQLAENRIQRRRIRWK